MNNRFRSRSSGLLIAALLVGVGACDARRAESGQPAQGATLTADRSAHDFGRVPIDGGPVETVFRVANDGPRAVRLLSVATSCGCTKAQAEFSDGSAVGSFDVSDGGSISEAGRIVAPGEVFDVRIEFDPAAHGPDGVGQLMREIVLAMPDGNQTRLVITADVFRG